jgi:hypothetical protein
MYIPLTDEGKKSGEDTKEEPLEGLASLQSITPRNNISLKKVTLRVMNSNLN